MHSFRSANLAVNLVPRERIELPNSRYKCEHLPLMITGNKFGTLTGIRNRLYRVKGGCSIQLNYKGLLFVLGYSIRGCSM